MSYSKLRGRIREIFGTQGAFAKEMGMNRSTLSMKLSGKIDWTRKEIEKACYLLKISIDKVHLYFFTVKVGISQQ